MKLFSKWYIAAVSLLLMSLATPAPSGATVQQRRPLYLPGGNSPYPGVDNHLFNCMPEPRNQEEKDLQTKVMHDVIACAGKYGPDNERLLEQARVDIMVFYNGRDALDTLGIKLGGAEVPAKPGETGRSWTSLEGQPSLNNPTTSIWVWSLDQWNSLNGTVPSSVNDEQVMGTTKYELGHQFDVLWAKVQNPSWRSITQNDLTWIKAINCDARSIDIQTVESARAKWPRLFLPGKYAASEIFTELTAMEVGGVDLEEDEWLKRNFSCASYYVHNLEQSHGTAPVVSLPYNSGVCKCSQD